MILPNVLLILNFMLRLFKCFTGTTVFSYDITITPRVFEEKPPLAVLWSRVGPVENLRDFVPNHFVPLLSRNMIYLSGTVNIKINFKDKIFFPLHMTGSNCLLCRKKICTL